MFSDADGNSIPFDDDKMFFKLWNNYSVTVESDKGPITIKWHDVQSLAANWFMQTGVWSPNLQQFFEQFPRWCNFNWANNQIRGVYNLPDNPVIVDIGAGNSVLDIMLHKYHPNSTMYLVDRNKFVNPSLDPTWPSAESPCWHHSWKIVEDAIQANNLDRSKFHFLDVADPWTMEADMITSFMAWGMHFPKEMYWDRVLGSLKVGGRLVMDINIGWEQEYIEQISDAMNCRHTVITSIMKKPMLNDKMNGSTNRDHLGICAYRCSWIRH